MPFDCMIRPHYLFMRCCWSMKCPLTSMEKAKNLAHTLVTHTSKYKVHFRVRLVTDMLLASLITELDCACPGGNVGYNHQVAVSVVT